MDALEAIRSRHMKPRVGAEAPSRSEIEQLLELAVRAPNHHQTEPWRFHVLVGEGRRRLARAIADEAVETGSADPELALEEAWKKVDRAPVIIAVTCLPSQDPKVVEQEELVSVAMAVENLLLGAHDMGLGAMLRTGPASYHPAVREHLGLEANEKVVGLVYLGYPVAGRPLTKRRPASELTRWVAEPG